MYFLLLEWGMTDAIVAEGLTRYYGELCAVDNISFRIKHGELFGLLGPNGAGKTTCIKMLTTVLRPTKGRATICGFDTRTDADEVRKRIAVVQQGRALDIFLNVRDNLVIYAKLHDIPSTEIKERIDWVLEKFDLRNHHKKAVSQLSGGLMRRVQVARVFMCKPEVMFLDEPTSGLDPVSRRTTWEMIRSVSKEEKKTIFLTTQSMEEADKLSERVAILNHGKVLALDSPANLKRTIGRNSIIEITTENPKQKVVDMLESMKGIKSAHFSGNTLFVNVKDGNASLPLLVECLTSNKVAIVSINLHEPSLEDVFLKITGSKIGG